MVTFKKLMYYSLMAGTAAFAGLMMFAFVNQVHKLSVRGHNLRQAFKYRVDVQHDRLYYTDTDNFVYTNGILIFRDGLRSNEIFISTRQFTIKTQHD